MSDDTEALANKYSDELLQRLQKSIAQSRHGTPMVVALIPLIDEIARLRAEVERLSNSSVLIGE